MASGCWMESITCARVTSCLVTTTKKGTSSARANPRCSRVVPATPEVALTVSMT